VTSQRRSTTTRRERRARERAERAGQPRPRTGYAGSPRRAWWQSPFVLVSGAAVLAAIALVAFAMVGAPDRPDRGAGLVEPDSPVPVALARGEELGAGSAPVVLEVYSDYQCPVCGRFARDYLSRLVTDFVQPGTLRIVDRPIAILDPPGGTESLDAAVGAVCAGRQDRYWAYHDYLMANQDGENEGAFRPEVLRSIAEATDLDLEAWQACFEDPAVGRQVRSETAAAAAAGIRSTPTFILNGQPIVGLVAYEDLAGAIRALASAASPGASPVPSAAPSGS
jgi:protein-disulfide isomerase